MRRPARQAILARGPKGMLSQRRATHKRNDGIPAPPQALVEQLRAASKRPANSPELMEIRDRTVDRLFDYINDALLGQVDEVAADDAELSAWS